MAQTGHLSTHMLNAAEGVPAAGVPVELWRLEPVPVLVARITTTADGRALLFERATFIPGLHELRFAGGACFTGRDLGKPRGFLDEVPVRVRLEEGQGHHHVPLLCSPFGYTTCRGS